MFSTFLWPALISPNIERTSSISRFRGEAYSSYNALASGRFEGASGAPLTARIQIMHSLFNVVKKRGGTGHPTGRLLCENARHHSFRKTPEGEAPMSKSLSQLIEMAKAVKVTREQQEEQRRSFVYGNTAFENSRITKEMVYRNAAKTPVKAEG